MLYTNHAHFNNTYLLKVSFLTEICKKYDNMKKNPIQTGNRFRACATRTKKVKLKSYWNAHPEIPIF